MVLSVSQQVVVSPGTSTAGTAEAQDVTQVHLPVLLPRQRVSAEYWASRGGGEGADGRQERERTTDTHTHKERTVLEVGEGTLQNRSQLSDSSPVKSNSETGDVIAPQSFDSKHY